MKFLIKFWFVNIFVIYIKVVEYMLGWGIYWDMFIGLVCVCVNINFYGDFNILFVYISNFFNFLVYIYNE